MALEKMKLEYPYPISIKIEEIEEKELIDLDAANSSPKDIVLEWHLEIRNFFARNVHAIGEAKLIDLMKYYIKSLRERAINFEDTETLQIMMDKHMGHIYWLYKDLDICYSDSYLDHMEHILTFYVNLSFRLLLDLKRKTKITQLMVRNRSQAILKRLSFYLLSSEYHIFHVLIRQSSSLVEDMVRDVINIHNSNICKQMFRNIYIFFLVKNAVQDKSDEAFCRGFILFENWKAFDDYKQNGQIECCLTKLFNRGSECIKTNPILRKILEPKPSVMTQLMKAVGCDASITKAYFDHIKSKQKESSDILEGILKMAQDMDSSSDQDWDEDDEDARYKELYDKVIGMPRKQRALCPNSVRVKEEKISTFENLSIDEEIHIINSDSDSDSIKLISIIPSQRNHAGRIRRNRMNNKAVEFDPTRHSYLDSISLDADVNKRKKNLESRRNLSLTKPIEVDRNQNESLNSTDQNNLESAPEEAEICHEKRKEADINSTSQNRLNIEEDENLDLSMRSLNVNSTPSNASSLVEGDTGLRENTSSIPNVHSSKNETRNSCEEQKDVEKEISNVPHEEVQPIHSNVTSVQRLVLSQQIETVKPPQKIPCGNSNSSKLDADSAMNVNSSKNENRNSCEKQKDVEKEISTVPHEEVQPIHSNVTSVQSLVPPQQIETVKTPENIPCENSNSSKLDADSFMNGDDLEVSPLDPSLQSENSSVEKIRDISKDSRKIVATIKTSIFRKSISTDRNEKESSQKGSNYIDDLFSCSSPSVVENTELRNRSESLEFEKMKQPQSSVETKEILSEKVPNEATALPSGDGAVEKTKTNAGAVCETQETVANLIPSFESSAKVTYEPPKSSSDEFIRIDFPKIKTSTKDKTEIEASVLSAPIKEFPVTVASKKSQVSEDPALSSICAITPNIDEPSTVQSRNTDTDLFADSTTQDSSPSKKCVMELTLPHHSGIVHPPNELPEAVTGITTVIDDNTQNDFEIEISTNDKRRENIFIKVRKKSTNQSRAFGFLDTGQSVSLQDTGQTKPKENPTDLNDEMVLDQTSAQNPIQTTSNQNVEVDKSQLTKNVHRVISPPGYLTPPGSDKEGDKNAEEFSSSVYTNIASTATFANDNNLCCADQGEASAIDDEHTVEPFDDSLEDIDDPSSESNREDGCKNKNSSLAKTYEQIVADAVGNQNSTENELKECSSAIVNIENGKVNNSNGTQSQYVDTFTDMEQFLRNCEHDDDAISLPRSSKKRKNSTKNEPLLSDNNDSSNKPVPAKPKKRVTIRNSPEYFFEEIDACSVKTEFNPMPPHDIADANYENQKRRSRRRKEKTYPPTTVYNSPKNGINHHTSPLSNHIIIEQPPPKGILKNILGYVVINDDQSAEGRGKRVKIRQKSFTAHKVSTEDEKLKSGAFVSMERLSPSVLSGWERITQRSRGEACLDMSFSQPDDTPMYQVVFNKSTPELNKYDRKYYCEPSNAGEGLGVNLENIFEAVNFPKKNSRSSSGTVTSSKNKERSLTRTENTMRNEQFTPQKKQDNSDNTTQNIKTGRKRKLSARDQTSEEKKVRERIPEKTNAKGRQTKKANGAKQPRGKKQNTVLEVGNS